MCGLPWVRCLAFPSTQYVRPNERRPSSHYLCSHGGISFPLLPSADPSMYGCCAFGASFFDGLRPSILATMQQRILNSIVRSRNRLSSMLHLDCQTPKTSCFACQCKCRETSALHRALSMLGCLATLGGCLSTSFQRHFGIRHLLNWRCISLAA